MHFARGLLLTALQLSCGPGKAPERRESPTVPPTAHTVAADTAFASSRTSPVRWFTPSANDSAELLFLGTYDPGQVRALSGQTWFGFFKSDTSWELVATRVTVDSNHTPCSAHNPREPGYPRITIDRPGTPLFLVRGLPGLKPGTVRSISRRREQVYPGQRIGPFIAGAELWELLAYGTAAPSRTPPSQAAEPAIRDYQLILWTRRGDRAQPIFQQAAVYSPPTVLWIGDLDGDGQADVLLDPATGGEEPVPLVLWASSLAGPTELAHKVAGYRTIYCD